MPSPIQPIKLDPKLDYQLHVKREDLIHPQFGGNKWRKLKYNLDHYLKNGYSDIVTFGGAFSNHIAATASVCHHYNIPCVGIIRGTYEDLNNPTLQRAKAQGMRIHHIPKVDYKLKENAPLVKELLEQYAKPYIIPEGGSNHKAMKGCAEAMEEINEATEDYDYIILAAGTGMTAAGFISAKKAQEIIVVNVLKNPSLKETISDHLQTEKSGWSIDDNFHFGGYAKTSQELIDFINHFYATHQILLDPIYNAKAMYAAMGWLEGKAFPTGSKVLYILTGGQQGVEGYNYTCKQEGQRILV